MSASHSNDCYEWRAHPARDRWPSACLAGLVMLVFAALSAALMEHALWGIVALAILFVPLQRFFLPSRFSVDSAGITAHTLWGEQRYQWNEVRRFLADRRGGFLSTRSRSSWLDSLRGMHVVFDGNPDAALASIRAHLDERRPA